MDDSISRQAAIEVIDAVFPVDPMKTEYAQGVACGAALAKTYVEQLPSAQPEKVCIAKITLSEEQVREAVEKAKSGIVQMFPSAQPEQKWIPCSERLPEEDTEVLISYRYKEGEGDTDHVNIDITSYGTVCFGGREIHTLKEWRQPFDYFHANYEVIAWMPLPTPYREE